MKSYEISLSRLWRVEFVEEDENQIRFSITNVAEDSVYLHGNVQRQECFNYWTDEGDFFHGCGPEDVLLFVAVYEIAMTLMGEKVEYRLELLERGDFIRELNLD